MEKLNVVIADDHPIVLVGVRELVERDKRFNVVGEALDSTELVNLLEQQSVDVVITDFNMPADSPYGDGLKLVEYLTRHFPAVHILVLTMISNPLILTRLQELGVVGVIQKNQLHDEIQVALKSIANGTPFHSAGPQSTSVIESVDLDERFTLLSPKEHEILRLFISGQSVNEIARGLNRSAKTISTQKVSAMRKLEVTSDQALLAYCIERKLFN
ncbi:two component LuxR family transcriptional regulator [Pseudomonas sp. FH4]|jgi:two-component system, NarL family, captular synthesis response regulator RcsB|uniref:Response regulator n=1 Tax=Pseudomonas brenneri TaxID=129817 RepID=A0A5B2UYC6_9PSED|nr:MULTISPECIES: response regulator [Pseudomonas]KAA6168328.1 response regulator [Pseudomonas marginalis]ETK18266.1 two component LuxR family transcriptional regulator [Pseudomonas sp. FH4]KAA2231836.1 response regulator [Pseudomonas brenneri]MBF8007097.1 response regulator [Pseudomonas brenneri]MBT9302373.1 response regulator [Pseudomonas sp. TAE6080]